jgi:hypothetical protein
MTDSRSRLSYKTRQARGARCSFQVCRSCSSQGIFVGDSGVVFIIHIICDYLHLDNSYDSSLDWPLHVINRASTRWARLHHEFTYGKDSYRLDTSSPSQVAKMEVTIGAESIQIWLQRRLSQGIYQSIRLARCPADEQRRQIFVKN